MQIDEMPKARDILMTDRDGKEISRIEDNIEEEIEEEIMAAQNQQKFLEGSLGEVVATMQGEETRVAHEEGGKVTVSSAQFYSND